MATVPASLSPLDTVRRALLPVRLPGQIKLHWITPPRPVGFIATHREKTGIRTVWQEVAEGLDLTQEAVRVAGEKLAGPGLVR